MRALVTGPNGKKFSVNADSEAALNAALQELFAKPRDYAKEMVALLERLVERPEPEAPESLDLTPVVEAVEKLAALERKEPEPVDLAPLAQGLASLAAKIDRLATQQAKADRDEAKRQDDLMAAIAELRTVMAAPRRLIRDSAGRPIGSEIGEA